MAGVAPPGEIPPEDDAGIHAQTEAQRLERVYAEAVKRPLNVVLGWDIPGWLLTGAPVALIVAEGLAGVAVGRHTNIAAAGLVVALAVDAAALLRRHQAPVVVLAIVLAVAVAIDYAPVATLPVLLGVFTVAEYQRRSTVIAAGLGAALVLSAIPLAHGADPGSLPEVLSHFIPVGLAVAVGLYLRTRADFITGLEERAERLERERELLAAQAVAEERVRIARELHDVVAHNVSLMVVQAQAMAAAGGNAEGLRRLASIGREAMAEMHRMLGVLRLDDGGGSEREPQPGVRDVEVLIARAREAGVHTSLSIQGNPRELPPGVDLSAYRIVQEALTNVIRHAGAGHADVTLSYSPDVLDVTIIDDGAGPAATVNGAHDGHGLVGMRERAALFGGRLDAGARPDGHGYRVRAILPTG